MTKTVGMYGGKFLPLHMGHVYAMITASTMVDELHVIVSHDREYERKLCEGSKMEHVPHTVRLRWWHQITKDMPHVHVHAVYEEQTGNVEDWARGAEGIKKAIGEEITHVFSSESSYGPFFKTLYLQAEHVVIDEARGHYDISATRIRTDGAIAHWDMLPEVVKPYFLKRVVVVGTESCGKSTLVKNLANLYNTKYVEEFGRTYYERLGNCADITLPSDYPEIAFEHKYQEKMQANGANRVLFIDTEALVTQYYSVLYTGVRSPVVDAIIEEQQYDLWLLLEPDVKWVNDGTRTFGEDDRRLENHAMLKGMLDRRGIKYVTINGNYEKRLQSAINEVDVLLGL